MLYYHSNTKERGQQPFPDTSIHLTNYFKVTLLNYPVYVYTTLINIFQNFLEKTIGYSLYKEYKNNSLVLIKISNLKQLVFQTS